MNAEDAQKYLKRNGVESTDQASLLKAIEEIPSDRLDAEKKARFVTYFKGFGKEASSDDIKAMLVSFCFIWYFATNRLEMNC